MPATSTVPHLILAEVRDRCSGMAATGTYPDTPWTAITMLNRRPAEQRVYTDGTCEVFVVKAPSPLEGRHGQHQQTVWTMDVSVSVCIAQPENVPDTPTEQQNASLDWLGLHGINTIMQAMAASVQWGSGAHPTLCETVAVIDSAIGTNEDESEAGVSVTYRFTFQTHTDNLATTTY